MQNILPIDFIDVMQMAGSLVLRHSTHFRDDVRRQSYAGSPHHDTQTILLRGLEAQDDLDDAELAKAWFADVAHEDRPLLAQWPSARQVIEAIAASIRTRFGYEAQFGKVMVVSLRPGGHVDWHRDEGAYAEKHNRFHLCLVPSPGAWLYSGGEAQILPVGQLTYFNNRVLHSAINIGPVARVHLIVDVRVVEQKQ